MPRIEDPGMSSASRLPTCFHVVVRTLFCNPAHLAFASCPVARGGVLGTSGSGANPTAAGPVASAQSMATPAKKMCLGQHLNDELARDVRLQVSTPSRLQALLPGCGSPGHQSGRASRTRSFAPSGQPCRSRGTGPRSRQTSPHDGACC